MHNDHLLTIHGCSNDLQRRMRDEARSVDMDNVSGYSTDQEAKNREKVFYFEFYSFIPVGGLGIISNSCGNQKRLATGHLAAS